MITERDITVWIISALLAIGIGWSRYAKWRTRDKIVRELAAMDPDRREKMLSGMNPRLAMEMREQLMKRFRMGSHWHAVVSTQVTVLPNVCPRTFDVCFRALICTSDF